MTTDIEELEEIKTNIESEVSRARHILRKYPDAKERAEAYWIPAIITGLRNDHGYLGGVMATMEDTINEMQEEGEDD